MKSWTHVDCPWDLVGFGGTRSYHDLLAALPAHVPHGQCFPAGHASAGHAWVALLFFFGRTRPQWRWQELDAGLCAGLVLRFSQHHLGAHFTSHDTWTMMVSSIVAFRVHRIMPA